MSAVCLVQNRRPLLLFDKIKWKTGSTIVRRRVNEPESNDKCLAKPKIVYHISLYLVSSVIDHVIGNVSGVN